MLRESRANLSFICGKIRKYVRNLLNAIMVRLYIFIIMLILNIFSFDT
jgi:hypothetical protein